LLPSGWAAQIAGQIPGAQSAVIDNAGHCPQIEQADAVNALLLKFLRETAVSHASTRTFPAKPRFRAEGVKS
jgi:hypothetical protein